MVKYGMFTCDLGEPTLPLEPDPIGLKLPATT